MKIIVLRCIFKRKKTKPFMPHFSDYALDVTILKALEQLQYTEPSAVQEATIPLILERKDIIALAKTGSGKTAACAIPICNMVLTEQKYIQALIIVPTRELALQYAAELQKIGSVRGVKIFAIFGGESSGLQLSKINHGVHVLVTTPGRLIDFIYSREIDLSHVKTLVLDEADEMFSMGFYDDLKFVMGCLVHEHQTLLFSATMPKQIIEIAKHHMVNPQEIVLTVKDEKLPSQVNHHFLYCNHTERGDALLFLMEQFTPSQSIIFCHSRIEVEKVCRLLQQDFDGIDFLHAGLEQKMRTVVTNKFRSGKIKHLVATDVASRGLDFSGVTHVFIYHLGDDPDVYVHRSGRTGRYDRAGAVVTLVTDRELGVIESLKKTKQLNVEWIGDPPPERGPSRGRSLGPGRHPPRKPSQEQK